MVTVHDGASSAPFYTIALRDAAAEPRERQTIAARLRPRAALPASPSSVEEEEEVSMAKKVTTGLLFGGVGLRRLLAAADPAESQFANTQSIWVWRSNTHTVVVPEAGAVVAWEFTVKGHESGQDVGFTHTFEELSAGDAATSGAADAAAGAVADAAAAADVGALKDTIAALSAEREAASAAESAALAERATLRAGLDAASAASEADRAALAALNASCAALRTDVASLEETIGELRVERDAAAQRASELAQARAADATALARARDELRDEQRCAVASVEARAFAAEQRAAAAESSAAALRRELNTARDAAATQEQQSATMAEVVAQRIEELTLANAAQAEALAVTQAQARALSAQAETAEAEIARANADAARADAISATAQALSARADADAARAAVALYILAPQSAAGVLTVQVDGSVLRMRVDDAAALEECELLAVEELGWSGARRLVALRSRHGGYLSAGDDALWGRTSVGPLETIEVLVVAAAANGEPEAWALKCAHGTFFSARADGTFGWDGAATIGEREVFRAAAQPMPPSVAAAADAGVPGEGADVKRGVGGSMWYEVNYAMQSVADFAYDAAVAVHNQVEPAIPTQKDLDFHQKQGAAFFKAVAQAIGVGGVDAAESAVASTATATTPAATPTFSCSVAWDRISGEASSVTVPLTLSTSARGSIDVSVSAAAAPGGAAAGGPGCGGGASDAVGALVRCAIAAEPGLAGVDPSSLTLMYRDDEGDLVTVTRGAELTEAVRVAHSMELPALEFRLALKDAVHGHRITVF